MNMSNDKSKKNKSSHINKAHVWNIFETEIENDAKSKTPLECIALVETANIVTDVRIF